jgi:4-hydroxythreonine-4-phosphate dehydrogenase
MNQDIRKPIIGFTCGDLNGVGLELIIKSLSDIRLLEFMVPVIFAHPKAINFYSKGIPDFQMPFSSLKFGTKLGKMFHSRLAT